MDTHMSVAEDDDLCLTCGVLLNDTFDNSSLTFGNGTTEEVNTWSHIALLSALSVVLTILILATVVGNILVIIAVYTNHELKKNVANRLIVSLALADCGVGLLVMPVAFYYHISGSWDFGAIGCDLWTSADVLSCTASILHLLAVALDRYWAVSRINWTVNRNKTHITMMILTVWVIAFLVSVAPLVGWKDAQFWDRIQDHRCTVSPDVGYQVFATMVSFYLPTALILGIYWKVWQTAKSRIRHRVGKANHVKLPTPAPVATAATKIAMSNTFSADELSCHTATIETSTESVLASPIGGEDKELDNMNPPLVVADEESGVNPCVGPPTEPHTLRPPPPNTSQIAEETKLNSPENEASPSGTNKRPKEVKKRKETLEAKRERKAAKTLAVITGLFVLCWCPFFLMAIILPLCGEACDLPEYVAIAFQWLGYVNSTINPCIYTIFSPDFREAFRRLLFGRRGKGVRGRR